MSFEDDKYYVDKDPYEWCLRQSKRLEAIDSQMDIQMRNHKPVTQLPGELEDALKCRCNQNCTLDDIANTLQDIRKRTNIGKFTPYKSSGFREKQSFRVDLKTNPKKGWQKWQRREILVTIVVQQTTMPKTDQRQRKKSMQLRKSQGRNPQQRILNQNPWVMPSEDHVMMSKTQEKNF
ncbi:hypothetical protein O181_112144 [Austropuccinia psidii MF-1]|uniref:Uncharacterized protein n=1 Tax=Austropuccinia psidii MF-1 TaxID=1389203 RepID=A0A9Q3K1B9_9BASI|nr:hypothetical protein [Austropuccinia psidii MF-1]